MNDLYAVGGVVLVLAILGLVAWLKRKAPRDAFSYQDWQAQERRQRIVSFKAPAPKGFERRLRRRSS